MTQPFPVSHSNLSAPHLGHFVQKKYGLLGEITCRLIRSGINDTYLVQANAQKYVFRVYSLHWRTQTEITEEIRLLLLLQSRGISVSYPISDSENTFIQTLNAPEGERFGVLFSYANGEKLPLFPTAVHYTIGQTMAKLHQVTENLTLQRTTYTLENLLQQPLVQIGQFLSETSEEMAFLRQTQAFLLDELSEAPLSTLRTGAVHLDIWFENLNVDADQQVTLFDFDFCGNGWLALDVAFYVMQVYNIEREEAVCAEKLRHFFAGYESVHTLSETEKRLMPALGISLYFFYLGVQCQRFDNWSNTFLSESYLKRYINALVKRYWGLHYGEKPA